jgi:hypothetical protein
MAGASNGFWAPEPCWVIVNNETGGLVGMENDHGQQVLPIFTDDDLADRFLEDSPDAPVDTDLLPLDQLGLAAQLEAAHLGGVLLAVFDPPASRGSFPRTWPTNYAAQRIRNGQELQ